MPTPNQLFLLRRTFVVLAAALTLGAMSDAQAQGKVKLSGASGKDECSYSSMSITPDGSVTVQCSGTTQPPPPPPTDQPGTFAFSNTSITAAPLAKALLTVSRTGGSKGSFSIALSPYGASCWGNPSSIEIADGLISASFEISMGDVVGSWCEIMLGAVTPTGATTGATIGSANTARVTVSNGTSGPVANANCPTGFVAPENMTGGSLLGFGNPLIAMQKSGQVMSIPLPALNGLTTGQITFGESTTAATPQPVTLEISINKCPGFIDTSPSSCNVRSTMSSYNSITWFAKAYSIITDAASADRRGYCWGGDATQYYVNARWTYQSCPFGAQVCGFAVQYNQGPY